MVATSWTQHFASLPSNEQGNQNISSFADATSSNLPRGDCLRNITEEQDYVILTADGERKIQILHSLKNTGGTRLRPESKVIALVGTGNVAVPVVVKMESILAECAIRTPLIEEFRGCSTAGEVAALATPSERGQTTLEGSACFLPAPFLRDAVLSAGTNEPNELMIIAMAAAVEFDRINDDEESFPDKAVPHAEDFMLWSWGVGNGRITETRFSLRPEDGELQTHLSDRQQQCIMPSTGAATTAHSSDNSAVLTQLTESISQQTKEAAASNELRREEIARARDREEIRKDKMKKLHDSTINMIKMAASADFDRAADEVPASCKEFYQKETEGQADQELSLQFEAMGMGDVNFAHGFVQALRNGNFLFTNAGTPNNYSIFCLFEQSPNSNDKGDRQLLLHLLASHAQGMSQADIKSLTKQVVTVPTDYNDLESRLNFFSGGCEIFFSDESSCTQGLKSFLKKIKSFKVILKGMMANNSTLAAEICYAVDIRVQLWLGACKMARDRSEVNDRLVNFEDIINDIVSRRFRMPLPQTFKSFKSLADGSANKTPSGDRGGKGETDPKKRKRDGGFISNTDQLEEFKMKQGETWTKDFCGKCVDDRPMWGGRNKMCPRWHSKGMCFTDCANSESHVPANKIPEDKKAGYRLFLKKIRNE